MGRVSIIREKDVVTLVPHLQRVVPPRREGNVKATKAWFRDRSRIPSGPLANERFLRLFLK